MEEDLVYNKTYDKINFKENCLKKGEYESCAFNSCDFSNADLSEIKFLGCSFTSCNLSLVKLRDTSLRDIVFKGCKMLGLHFDACNKFGLSFRIETCPLNHSIFYKVKIRETTFINSQLNETDFTESDLTGSVFDNCDLTGATFEQTIIEKADFRTSYNYSIDPEINRIKKAKFSLPGVVGLLNKYDIQIDGRKI
jgi:uncharacterized protein YjbI with pentapeptide repeats